MADAARREWAEATAGIAEAAEQARAELDRRGLDRWDEAITDMQTGTEREVHTDELAAEAEPGLAAIDSATVDADLACVEAGAAALAEKRAHDQAERDHAAVNEPVIRTSTQALFEIAAQAETEQDADIEI